ncbi:MAG: YcxB family protein [Clostridia bacterium]|nr:YcxB family protein [Clostridia bacterium]
MHFSFDVKLTDADYIRYNEFALKNSSVSKKTDVSNKILVSLIFIAFAINLVVTEGITPTTVVGIILLCACELIFLLGYKKWNSVFTKSFTRMLVKGRAKKPYTPESVLEFYDDFFKEIAPDNKSEVNYTAIDRICVIMNQYAFIFIDGMRGYIVPFECFRDKEEENAFLAFLGTLTKNIEFFEKI